MRQLHIQQPVFQICRRWPIAVKQKILLRLFTQDAVLDAELVIGQLNFLDSWQVDRSIVGAQLPLGVVPKDNTVLLEKPAQRMGDLVFTHRQAPIWVFIASTKRLAQGDASMTLPGSIRANSLKECSPFPYCAFVLQSAVAFAKDW